MGAKPQESPEKKRPPPIEGAGRRCELPFSTTMFSNAPLQRFGDLFPLPLPRDDGYVGDVSALHSRRSRQRVQKRRLLVSREIETVKCLNHLAGFADESSWPSSPTNFSQKSALQVVSEAHFKRPPPPERETPQAALRQLLSKKVSSGYESGDAPGQVVAYQRALLSLPRDQQDPVQLSHLLPAKEKEQLEHFADSMLLSDEEMAGVLERGFSRDKYLDPVLEGDQTEYHAFVADLFACKLLDFTIAPKSQVGVFCVAKKSGKQRLVVDARRTNKLFRSPPSTLLGSADTWTRLEFDEPGAEFFVAQEDVKDFFYRLRIHRPLGEYFALPAIDPVQLRDALGFLPPGVEELLDRHTAPIHPFFQVLPMGFSWSFHLAHMAHVELSARCLPHCGILQDRRPAPILGHGRGQHSSALLIYADNNNHIGIEREKLLEEQKNMIGSLHSHGLETHEVTDPVSLAESLGIRINGATGQVGTTAARDWRLDRALEGLAFARPRISGQELEVIVGHMTIRALLHRGLMSILRHAYVFIRRFYHQRHRLWASVALELRIFRGLMALGTANVFAAWDGQPICTDACLSGYAAMESQHSSQEVASLGRYDERWRFRWGDGRKVAPRSQALDTSKVFEDPKTVLPEVTGEVFGDLELVAGFPEVGHDFMNEKAWHPLWNSHITHKEPVHMIEARSILAAVKHRSRDHHRHRKKILILNDNMSVVLALQKGRCHNYGLLRIIRRISAHALATGQRFHIRWLASELNVADKGSRQWESERRAEDFEKRKAPKRGANFFQDRGCACKPEDAKPFSGGRPKEEEESVTFEGEGKCRSQGYEQRIEAADKVSREEEEESYRKTEEVRAQAESKCRGKDHFGDPLRERATKERILSEAGRILQLRSISQPEHSHRRRARHSHVRLCRRAFPRWGGVSCRRKVESCPRVRTARGDQVWPTDAAQVQASHEGMAQISAAANTPSHDGVPQELHQWSHDGHGGAGNVSVQRNLIFNLCPTRRAAQASTSRCGSACPRTQLRRVDSEPNRTRGNIESRNFRRDVDPGRQPRSMAGGALEPVGGSQEQRSRRRRTAVALHSPQVPGDLATVCESSRGGRRGGDPLPESSWRRQPGPPSQTEECGEHSTEGEVGKRQQLQNLQQTRETSTNRESAWQSADGFRRECEKEFSSLVPHWVSGDPKAGAAEGPELQKKAFLSLFGGAGNPAKQFADLGGLSLLVDLSHSLSNDLSKFSIWNQVFRALHFFDCVGVDLPCNTWSRARRAPPWSRMPKPLRSADFLFGLPHLETADFLKVQAANRMFFASVRLIRRCLRLGTRGYLENPATSFVWDTPQIQRLLKHPKVQLVTVHMCMYGCQWKKPTKLLLWNCAPVDLRRCSGKTRCSRTGRPHLQLSGLSGKRFLTEQAQMYSTDFSKALVGCFNTP